MRGTDQNQSTMFSYVSPEARIPADHPLRSTREMTNKALAELDRKFRKLYSRTGRGSSRLGATRPVVCGGNSLLTPTFAIYPPGSRRRSAPLGDLDGQVGTRDRPDGCQGVLVQDLE